MATPISSRPVNHRYLGNSEEKQVHDLNNEKRASYQCQIDEIIRAKNAVVFSPDTLSQAKAENYDPCYWCIGQSTR